MLSRLAFLRSLQARLIMLTLATIFLVLAITLGTASHYQKQLAETVTVDITATTIRTLRAALAEIPPGKRSEFVRKASLGQWYLRSRTLPTDARLERRPHQAHSPGMRPPPADLISVRHGGLRKNLREFINALNLKLDDETRVGLSRGPSPRLYISLLPDRPLSQHETTQNWLVIPLDPLAPPLPVPMAAIWLSAMGLLLLLSAAFSWHITRPLRSLAKAADQLAAGKPQRVIPTGPTETRILGERFNAMLDALAEAHAVRSTLLAGLPHDLKGPLSRMWLRTEMLDDDALKDGLLDDIQDMQRMVDQFIGFVRGSDPASYQFEPLDLAAWLQEKIHAWQGTGTEVRWASNANAAHTTGSTANHQTSNLPTPSRHKPLMVLADRAALDRLLDNLITNALAHAQPPINIGLDSHDGWVELSVSDHGKGIDRTRREEALRPFSRLDDARTRTGSVGLGLALCETIAQAHRGTLALDEAVSGGLKVVIRLPLA